MVSQLPRGPPCCSRFSKIPRQPATQSLKLFTQGRACETSRRPRRVIINAFLFKLPSSSAGKSTNRSRESIANRLSELRSRPDDETRNPSRQRPESRPEDDDRADEPSSGDTIATERPGPLARRQVNPWPAQTSGDDEGGANLGQGGSVTPRSLRYLISDPKPEIKLLHRFKPGQGTRNDSDFWRIFTTKCRLAWDVFFPPEPQLAQHKSAANALSKWGSGGFGRMFQSRPKQFGGGGRSSGDGTVINGLTAKQVVLSRLQMVLIADRCGVTPEHLLEMKTHTLTALAEYMGKDLDDDMSQLEVQVSALKPNGERLTMTIGFADMLGEEQLRDPIEYHYEQFEDDDDYFMPEDDGDGVADIAEAPAAGLKAARVRAAPVSGGSDAAAKGGKGEEA
ncbi:hypothetical protein Vretimale_2559 [Volvox reticuliferus]|uniref:Uncharacterized protein n=1 Tax=Volvox reticuliferus TaxID=1737510 RepID=A0A8J4DBI1_9CHLO|nr:hypothetical protein Vretifemale_4803 [Volvox reticuliferus]GIL96749.1 hypothetical protein Vretimale_2559 [Volvox reticuliferus]